ncbi:MAG: hypothetical protein Q9217_003067 [Psora testacea]
MSNKPRRKSLSILRPPMTGLTPINEPSGNSSPISRLIKRRPPTLLSSSPVAASPTSSDIPSPSPSTPTSQVKARASMDRLMQKTRPRSLQKGRPNSLFGSFRGMASSPDDEDNCLRRTTSASTSVHSQSEYIAELAKSQVLLHGEVQTASGMFRKRCQYLVLTDTHLVKFRSQSRASEMFPSIPSSAGRSSGARHSRLSSNGSVHELHMPNEGLQAIPLNQVVATYPLDDGKPYFSIEISHLDEETMQPSSMMLQLQDPRDQDLWLSSVRGAVTNARLRDPLEFSQPLVGYTVRVVEQDGDYDPNQIHMFRVVQRAGKSISRSSADDLTKLTSNVRILAIGMFKIHLIPLPKSSKTSSSSSLPDLNCTSYGLAALTSLTIQEDDAFSMVFRKPLRQQVTLSLAASCSTDIALSIRRVADWLRPEWPEQPFTWNAPEVVHKYEESLPIPPSNEPYQALNRTLAAYCAAYDLDAAGFRYTDSFDCEDAPVFVLQPHADGRKYTVLELLAMLRALRYNESFGTLCFQDIDLIDLQRLRDPYGHDHVPWTTKSGESLNQPEQANCTLLVQEVQALALKSRRLRRLDFTNCMIKRAQTMHELEEDPGSGICEALFPLCLRQLTNIDWVILNGLTLCEVDIDYIFSAAIDRSCHFRALHIGRCSLGDRNILTILNVLSHQSATMESIDISGNHARLDPKALHDEFRSFEFIRKMNLSDLSRITGPQPLLPAELLLIWRLEDLRLSRTAMNEESVDAIAIYLQSPQSITLRYLELDGCQLSGRDAATLFESMGTQPNQCRDLRVSLSGNRLEQGHEAFVKAIRRDKCPSQVVMQSVDYQNEGNFQRLLDAFARNTTVHYLDISRTSLPSDASESTCHALRRVLSLNTVLEYLDISGEQTHLVASSLGSGLNAALPGLKQNTSLRVLRIENQKLGLQGASTLASVLEENRCLQQLHCEGNEINLQAFTVLVGSLEHNETLLYLPNMTKDRAWAQKKVDREVDNLRDNSSAGLAAISSTKATVMRTISKTISGPKSNGSRTSTGSIPVFDIEAAIGSLSDQWDHEIARLHQYLSRNYKLTHGAAFDAPWPPDARRPGTSGSLATAIQDFSLEPTPKAELNRQLGGPLDGGVTDGPDDDSRDEGEEDEDEEEGESPLEMGKVGLHVYDEDEYDEDDEDDENDEDDDDDDNVTYG